MKKLCIAEGTLPTRYSEDFHQQSWSLVLVVCNTKQAFSVEYNGFIVRIIGCPYTWTTYNSLNYFIWILQIVITGRQKVDLLHTKRTHFHELRSKSQSPIINICSNVATAALNHWKFSQFQQSHGGFLRKAQMHGLFSKLKSEISWARNSFSNFITLQVFRSQKAHIKSNTLFLLLTLWLLVIFQLTNLENFSTKYMDMSDISRENVENLGT